MERERWAAVDGYLERLLAPPEPALDAALRASEAAGLPPIQVPATLGKLLHLLARAAGARAILEIGTLGGVSTIWLARALPEGGRLVTLEAEPRHAEVARANLERAGLTGRVDLRLGRALDTLPRLEAEGAGPFDLVFVDADKPASPDYLAWALRLSRPGSLLVFDNVVREGAVADAGRADASVAGVRRLLELLASDPRVDATAFQTVGAKGHDGLAIALVIGGARAPGAGPEPIGPGREGGADLQRARTVRVGRRPSARYQATEASTRAPPTRAARPGASE